MLAKMSIDQALIKAKSHIKKNEIAEAQKLYEAVLLAFPKNTRAKKGLDVLSQYIDNKIIKKTQPSMEKINTLLDHFQNGRYEQAKFLAELFTRDFPEHSFGWQVLGGVLKETGYVEEAIDAFKKSLLINPQDAIAHSNLGISLKDLGEFEEAEKILRNAISLNYNYAPAHNNLASTLKELGKYKEAEKFLRKAIALKPDLVEAYINLGKILNEMSRPDEAEEYLRKGINLEPTNVDIYNYLGIFLKELGKFEESENIFKKAISLKPYYAQSHHNLGNTLQEMGKLDEAASSYQFSIKLKYENAESHNNLGTVFKALGKLEEAEESLKKAINLNNNFVEAHNNLGNVLKERKRFDEAEKSYKKALKLDTNYADAFSNLGGLLHSRGLFKETIDCFTKAISLRPNNVSYRWDHTISQLPKIYLNQEEYRVSLQNFENELCKFEKFLNNEKLDEAVKVVGKSYPYYLAYFENNNRKLLEKHGEICYKIMKHYQEKELISCNNLKSNYKNNKIKIGIISAHISYHSVWNSFLKGIIKNLNLDKFELHIFSLGKINDKETDFARNITEHFYNSEQGINGWAKKITDSKIDIAFYPEIGMDKLTVQLASMRLAPVQICSWGHPETSGLPTMDYYISSDLLETSVSEEFYSEKLFKLPGLGYYFDPPTLETDNFDFENMGINPDFPILLCLGASNKFSPFYDWVFIEIISRINNCQLVFMDDIHGASEILKKRLELLINDAGLNFNKHIIFIPQQSRIGFSTLMKNSDILLDTIGFSGMNTAMQAIGCGLPIITREGNFQRTRHASAILKTIDAKELIANSEEEYIALIEKITLDTDFQKKIRIKIRDNEHLLYRNINAVRALEDFFTEVGEI